MTQVTGEQVKAACIAADIRKIDNCRCSICGSMTYYSRDEADELWFHPECDCSSAWGSRELRSWNDAACLINMQSMPIVRAAVAKRFGLALDATELRGTGQ